MGIGELEREEKLNKVESRKWVLIVDDEPEIRESLRTFIEMNLRDQVKIVEAKDGIEATTRIHFRAFDVILTGLKMPRKQGQDFVKSVRSSQLNSRTPIIVVTGFSDDSLGGDLIQVIEKPYSFEQISTAVLTQLKLKNGEDRISAELLNALVESNIAFYESVLKLPCQLGSPGPLAKGSEFCGDLFCLATVQSGKGLNQFLFGFSRTFLTKALPKEMPVQSDSLEKATRAAGQSILKRVVKLIGVDRIASTETQVLTGDSPKLGELKSLAGLVVPIQSEGGSVHIYALWPSP